MEQEKVNVRISEFDTRLRKLITNNYIETRTLLYDSVFKRTPLNSILKLGQTYRIKALAIIATRESTQSSVKNINSFLPFFYSKEFTTIHHNDHLFMVDKTKASSDAERSFVSGIKSGRIFDYEYNLDLVSESGGEVKFNVAKEKEQIIDDTLYQFTNSIVEQIWQIEQKPVSEQIPISPIGTPSQPITPITSTGFILGTGIPPLIPTTTAAPPGRGLSRQQMEQRIDQELQKPENQSHIKALALSLESSGVPKPDAISRANNIVKREIEQTLSQQPVTTNFPFPHLLQPSTPPIVIPQERITPVSTPSPIIIPPATTTTTITTAPSTQPKKSIVELIGKPISRPANISPIVSPIIPATPTPSPSISPTVKSPTRSPVTGNPVGYNIFFQQEQAKYASYSASERASINQKYLSLLPPTRRTQRQNVESLFTQASNYFIENEWKSLPESEKAKYNQKALALSSTTTVATETESRKRKRPLLVSPPANPSAAKKSRQKEPPILTVTTKKEGPVQVTPSTVETRPPNPTTPPAITIPTRVVNPPGRIPPLGTLQTTKPGQGILPPPSPAQIKASITRIAQDIARSSREFVKFSINKL